MSRYLETEKFINRSVGDKIKYISDVAIGTSLCVILIMVVNVLLLIRGIGNANKTISDVVLQLAKVEGKVNELDVSAVRSFLEEDELQMREDIKKALNCGELVEQLLLKQESILKEEEALNEMKVATKLSKEIKRAKRF